MSNKLYSTAQERSFLSRFRDKSRSSMERKINQLDDAIREIALNHGPHRFSLEQYAKKALKYLQENNFEKVEKYLTLFDQATTQITDTINKVAPEMVDLSSKLAAQNYNFTKQAGWFDRFKTKQD